MRVTNEQAIAVKNMVNGRTFIYASGNDIPADWFAIDLLEARETIKKQGEIINEMREALNGFRAGNCFCECGIDNPILIGRHDQNGLRTKSILENTKDYA